MKFIAVSLIALCLPVSIFCQDISGLWTGTLYNDSTQQFHDYEIGISKEKGKYIGFSKTWFVINQEKYEGLKKVKVRIATDGKIVIEDVELVFNNYPVQAHKEVRQLSILDIEQQEGQYLLSGLFVTNATKRHSPITGKIVLKRKSGFSAADHEQYLQNRGTVKEEATKVNSDQLVKNEKEK